MASVTILPIEDEIVGPHLELLRAICDPKSRARPHVTVRFFEKLQVPHEHLRTSVAHLDILEPGTFSRSGENGTEHHTVYLRCASEELLPLEHKPHFPASEFHITVYDGPSKAFARDLLKILQRHRWNFRLKLPPDTTLEEVKIRGGRRTSRPSSRIFSPAVHVLFEELTGELLSWELLQQLRQKDRLDYTDRLCSRLTTVTRDFHLLRRKRKRLRPSLVSNWSPSVQDPEVHLTPPELAISIAAMAVDFMVFEAAVHFGDPAVGTGAFYAALAHCIPRRQIASAVGVEISATQVHAAQSRWASRGMKVLQGDYLHMENLPLRNLILANPPYLRHQAIEKSYKLALRQRASVILGGEVSARSGQYVYFMLLSHSWMRPGAVAAWLIPSEFMQTAYGAALRDYLTRLVQLQRVHIFDPNVPQFENATVLPSVVLFRNAPASPSHEVQFSFGASLESPDRYESYTIQNLRSVDRWSAAQLRPETDRVETPRLGDLFDVVRGIATGANSYFVMERSEARELGIPQRALKPVLPKSRTLDSDVIEADGDGYPLVTPQLAMIDCDLSIEQIEARYPRFAMYLAEAEAEGIRDRTLVKARVPWYRQEQRRSPMFVCTYMGRGRDGRPPIRFFWNKSKAIATNTYLLLYPKARLASAFENAPEKIAEVFEALRETSATRLNEVSRVHAHGLRKIEPSELVNVHLANAPAWLSAVAVANGELSLGLRSTRDRR